MSDFQPLVITDDRGFMGIVDFEQLPFTPRRFFWLNEIPSGAMRGGHAHRTCEQLIVCISGSVRCVSTSLDGSIHDVSLKSGDSYYLPLFHWLELQEFTKGSNVGVFASEPYDEADYIRSRDEFNSLSK